MRTSASRAGARNSIPFLRPHTKGTVEHHKIGRHKIRGERNGFVHAAQEVRIFLHHIPNFAEQQGKSGRVIADGLDDATPVGIADMDRGKGGFSLGADIRRQGRELLVLLRCTGRSSTKNENQGKHGCNK